MTDGRKHDHIGLAAKNLEETVAFYTEILGFEVVGECTAPDGTPIKFLRNGGLNYEIFQPAGGMAPGQAEKVDHVSYVSDDIEEDYRWFMENGYECTTDGIEALDSAWEKGCRYFKIKGPGGEEIEFDQIV